MSLGDKEKAGVKRILRHSSRVVGWMEMLLTFPRSSEKDTYLEAKRRNGLCGLMSDRSLQEIQVEYVHGRLLGSLSGSSQ